MEDNEKALDGNQEGEEKVAADEAAKAAPIAEVEEGKAEETDFSKVEPEVRKRPIDYIKEREARRAERQQAHDGNVDKEEEETLTPSAAKLVERRVKETLDPVLKVIAEGVNDREVSEILAQNPDWKRYAPLAKKYMASSGWDGVPAKRIFQMLDYEYAESRGAEQAKAERPRVARSGGDSRRQAVRSGSGKITAEDIAKLTPGQFQDLQKRLAMGESIPTQ